MTLNIKQIKENVIQVANKYDITRVYLFGSCVRNTTIEKDDVDLGLILRISGIIVSN